MPSNAAWGIVVTIAIFVITHIGLTIWWASRVSTLLDVVQKDLSDIIKEFQALRGSYVSKEELSYRIASSDKEHTAMWRQIDDLKSRANQ